MHYRAFCLTCYHSEKPHPPAEIWSRFGTLRAEFYRLRHCTHDYAIAGASTERQAALMIERYYEVRNPRARLTYARLQECREIEHELGIRQGVEFDA